MSRPGLLEGIVAVDKPAGWTSHDVVARARRVLGERRVGHSGTLDPGATGVLILGVGRATRLLRFLTALPKQYEGEIVLGTETDTLDDAGAVVATHDMGGVEPDAVRAAAARFVGDIEQVPPMVSAVRVGGRRLHELARAGETVERASRPVTVHGLQVEPTGDPGIYGLVVECSSGTFVRTLAADIGRALGGGAHLRNLRRTAIGSFGLDDAIPLDDLHPGALQPAAAALRDYPTVTVADEVARQVATGRVFGPDELELPGEGPWAVVGSRGTLLAVYERRGGAAKPAVVLAQPGGK